MEKPKKKKRGTRGKQLDGRNNAAKITKEQTRQIITWLAWGEKTQAEIVKHVEEVWGVKPFYYANLYDRLRRKTWAELYEREVNAAIDFARKHPMGNKLVRLQRLDDIYEKSMELRVVGYDSKGEPVYKFQPTTAVQAIAQAHKEVEGNVVRHEGTIQLAPAEIKKKKPQTKK